MADPDKNPTLERVKKYASERNARLKKTDETTYRIKEGSYLTIDPNKVHAIFEIKRPEGGKTIVEYKETLLDKLTTILCRGSYKKIIKKRLNIIKNFLETKQDEPERFDIGYDSPSKFPFFVLYRATLAAILTFIVVLAVTTVGTIPLFDSLIKYFAARGTVVKEAGGLPLPSLEELNSLGMSGIIKCSFYFSFMLAFFMAFLFTVASLITRTCGFDFMNIFVTLFCALFYFISLFKFNLASAIIISIFGTASAVLIQRAVWLQGNINEREPHILLRLGTLLVSVFIVVMTIPFGQLKGHEKTVEGILEVRDEYLMSSRGLRPLANFYYKYTLYSAELKKQLFKTGKDSYPRLQATALVATKKEWIKKYLGTRCIVYDGLKSEKFPPDNVPLDGFDVFVIDPEHRDAIPDRYEPKIIITGLINNITDLNDQIEAFTKRKYVAESFGELDLYSRVITFAMVPFCFFIMPAIIYLNFIDILVSKFVRGSGLLKGSTLTACIIVPVVIVLPSAIEKMRVPDDYVRIRAMIKEKKIAEAKTNLKKWLFSNDARTVYWACNVAMEAKDPGVIPILNSLLSSDSIIIRYQSARALSELVRFWKADQESKRRLKERLEQIIRNDWWYVGEQLYEAYRAL